jgi:TrpR-related protein YerC/YecD
MASDRLRTPDVDALVQALLSLRDADEVYTFLQDVCTVREIQDISQRLAVARMLDEGKHYSDIESATGASSTTISRVSRALNYGADGYRAVLDRTSDEGGAR